MIAAGGGDDARRRHGAPEQVGERAARLEGAGVLRQLQLEAVDAVEAKVAAIDGQVGVRRTCGLIRS